VVQKLPCLTQLPISDLNEIVICQGAPQSSAPNRLVLLEHNNDTVLSFSSSDAAADAMNAILECQLYSLSLFPEKPTSPRWMQKYATQSFLLQVRCALTFVCDWKIFGCELNFCLSSSTTFCLQVWPLENFWKNHILEKVLLWIFQTIRPA
jgi:hypothetical protein